MRRPHRIRAAPTNPKSRLPTAHKSLPPPPPRPEDDHPGQSPTRAGQRPDPPASTHQRSQLGLIMSRTQCSKILRCPCRFSTICTAVAPVAVFTFCRNGLTHQTPPRVISAPRPTPKPSLTRHDANRNAQNHNHLCNSGQNPSQLTLVTRGKVCAVKPVATRGLDSEVLQTGSRQWGPPGNSTPVPDFIRPHFRPDPTSKGVHHTPCGLR